MQNLNTVLLLGVLAAGAIGCAKKNTGQGEPAASETVVYSLKFLRKAVDGEFKTVEHITGSSGSVSSRRKLVDHVPEGFAVSIHWTRVTDRTADFRLAWGGIEHSGTATPTGTAVKSADGEKKIVVGLVCSTVPPFRMGDERLAKPLTVYRIHPVHYASEEPRGDRDAPRIRGHRIIQTATKISPEMNDRIRSALSSRWNLTTEGAMCFDPGMALRFGSGADSTDVLLCLDCGWLYLYEPNTGLMKYGLSDLGKAELLLIYKELF